MTAIEADEPSGARRMLLSVEGVSKTFPGQVALAGVSLEVRAGEVCALVGQNGSGKSTLVKVLAGYYEADPGGTVSYLGRRVSVHERRGADVAWRSQVHFIHQELGLVQSMGTLDNLALGRGFETGWGGRILWRREAQRAGALFAEFGLEFDLMAPVATLSGAERTMVAVVRALLEFDDAGGVLILDEPTAALSAPEVDQLFGAVRRLARAGAGVIFISHRLEEVLSLADRVVVLRSGRVVADRDVPGLDHDGLIELMIGRALEPSPSGPRPDDGAVVLRARALAGGRVRDASFDVRAGEILGVAGLNGSGRDDLASLLFGGSPGREGEVSVGGEAVPPGSPRAAMNRGLALVPADRAACGMVASHRVRENVTLPSLRPLARRGLIDRRKERDDVLSWCRRVGLTPLEIERPIVQFSGGNQQKAVLAKWLRRAPGVLVLDEPTQGVDAGAKPAIYRLVRDAAAAGTAVLVCSSDNEELAQLADRTIVLSGGRVAAELSGEDLTADRITEATLRRVAA